MKKMSKSEAGRLGALARLEKQRKQRQAAKGAYDLDPKLCLACDDPIPFEKRFTNKFCSHSCSAQYNNPLRVEQEKKACLNCNQPIHKKKKYCNIQCQKAYEAKQMFELIKKGHIVSTRWMKRYLLEKHGPICMDRNCAWDFNANKSRT